MFEFSQVPTHDEKGERLQYYADDNANVSVRDMLERERLGLDEVGCHLQTALRAPNQVFLTMILHPYS